MLERVKKMDALERLQSLGLEDWVCIIIAMVACGLTLIIALHPPDYLTDKEGESERREKR